MKLSMEIAYVPEADFNQKKEMMVDWRKTSVNASNFSAISAVACFICAIALWLLRDNFFYINFASAAIYIIAYFACREWKFVGFLAPIIAFSLSCSRFFIEEITNRKMFIVVCVVAVVGAIPSFFAYRCAYNFRNVFKELKNSEGFPSFVANSADLYGKKIYIHDKEKTMYESKTEVSYNPFNTEEDISKEATERYHDTVVKSKQKPIEMNIGVDGKLISAEEENRRAEEKEKSEKKGGLFIGGFELIFAHSDLDNKDYSEKHILMGKWRYNLQMMENGFTIFVFLLMIAIMAANLGSLAGMLNYIVVLVFILGINQMKMGKWYGPVTTVIAIIYTTTFMNNMISVLALLLAYIYNIKMLVGIVRYVLNYKIYKKLKTQDGFPTFAKTTSELYAGKLYITEKREKVKMMEAAAKRPVKVMDIGFDEKPKKDEGAWNAFNYMDEKDEGK